MNKRIIPFIRWATRILASLMVALIAFMFVGNALTDGIGPLFKMTLWESLMMLVFIFAFLGLILGWKWEKLGGWLVVGGMALFYLFDFAFSGSLPRGPFFALIALPGILFLLTGYAQTELD